MAVSVDVVTVLIAGYAPMVTALGIVWRAWMAERKAHMSTMRRSRDNNRETISDLENRIAEMEHDD